MSINLEPFETGMPTALRHFWRARKQASKAQKKRGASDQGGRSSVTAGKNMDGFIKMVERLIRANGIDDCEIHTKGRINLTLPGYFRPTKTWDLLVVRGGILIAAIEFKSQVGPSFGNNFNNRVEEAIGNAVDINTAFREGAFGESSKPFVGYFFVLEDCEKSRAEVAATCDHFPILPEFENADYAQRYDLFCRKLIQEQLYDAAALVSSPTGKAAWSDISEMTSAARFAATLASRAVLEACGGTKS